MNSQKIQARDQAGHTKLTAVTIGHGRRKITAFVPLRHDAQGRAVLPAAVMDRMLDDLNVMRGQTFTVG